MSGAGSALVPREITIPTGSVSLGSSVCAFIYGSDSARVFRGTSRAGAGDENGSPPCARPLSHHFSRVLSTLGATTRARPEEPTAQWFRKLESRPRRPACIASTRLFSDHLCQYDCGEIMSVPSAPGTSHCCHPVRARRSSRDNGFRVLEPLVRRGERRASPRDESHRLRWHPVRA